MYENMTIADIGMEVIQTPITDVRIHRVDNQWLVEYRRKPKWYFDKWKWFNDGKYVMHNDAAARAELLVEYGFVTSVRYKRESYKVVK
jgi:hypothetical protein